MASWRVLLLDTKEENPNHHIVLAVEEALAQHPAVARVEVADYCNAIQTAVRQQCNLFLAFDGENLDRGICQRLGAVCGTSALWVTEDPYDNAFNVANAALFNYVFTNDSSSVTAYPGGANHLPLAASERFHHLAIPDQDAGHYLYDVLFIGTAWPNRVRFLRSLLAALPGLRIKLALPGNEHLPVVDLPVVPSSYLWRTPNTEMARFANRSRIVLALHREFSASQDRATAATPGPRLFETALAGGFQLVDLAGADYSPYFKIDKELIGFRTPEECAAAVRRHLSDPDGRLRIARAAQERCRSEHLYRHRINALLRRVEPARLRPVPSRARRKVAILHVAHNVIGVQPFGGVEVYVNQITKALPERYESLLYCPDRTAADGRRMILKVADGATDARFTLATKLHERQLSEPERESVFAQLLHDRRIDLVHFHHLHGHPWSLPLVARTLGVPTILSIADFLPVCRSHTLMTARQRFCGAPAILPESCDVCLGEQAHIEAGAQAKRRSFIGAVLENIDQLIFLSNSCRDIVLGMYPALGDHSGMSVEGYPLAASPIAVATENSLLRVAVPGNFSKHKGGDTLLSIFKAMKDEAIEFHVYGRIDQPYHDSLLSLDSAKVHLHGSYHYEQMADLLRGFDVGLLLSVWPETFVLTLSECWQANVVPIVTDIGALGERVSHGRNGFKVPVDEPGPVVYWLKRLAGQRSLLKDIRSNIGPDLYPTLANHLSFLSTTYEQLLTAHHVAERDDRFFAEPPGPRRVAAENLYYQKPVWFEHTLAPGGLAAFGRHALACWKKRGLRAFLLWSGKRIARRLRAVSP